MERLKIVVVGIGGKGVILTSRIIVEAAISKGIPAISSDEIGMSQRGGSVASHIKLGGFYSPMVGTESADVLIALHSQEGLRNLSLLGPGGKAVFNGGKDFNLPQGVLEILKDMGCGVYTVDGDGISSSLGFPRASNMAVIGLCAEEGLLPFSKEELKGVIASILPERLREVNLKAFEEGASKGRKIV